MSEPFASTEDEYFRPNCGASMLSHKIEVKGKCTACGKTLEENDGLFLCAECQKKQDAYYHSKMSCGKSEFIVYNNVCAPPIT